MRHLILYGEYELTIDEKNRLLVPSEIRKALLPDRDGQGFYLVVGINQRPWLYPELAYEKMVSQVQADLLPAEEQLMFDQMNFAMTARLEWDKQGRVLIPEKTLRRTGLERDVTMIGARDHLELWNREQWDAHREMLLAKSAEIAVRAKQVRQGA